jgi:hypothetical protein
VVLKIIFLFLGFTFLFPVPTVSPSPRAHLAYIIITNVQPKYLCFSVCYLKTLSVAEITQRMNMEDWWNGSGRENRNISVTLLNAGHADIHLQDCKVSQIKLFQSEVDLTAELSKELINE